MKQKNIIWIAAGLAAVYFLTKKPKKRGRVEVGPLEKLTEEQYNKAVQKEKL
jgi:hypothetical protein